MSKALSSLRRQLSPSDWEGVSIFVSDRFYVGLKPEFVETDVHEFEDNLKAAFQARNEAERIRCLEEAVNAYKGSLLPEFDDEWIEPERMKRSEQFEVAVSELVSACTRSGRLDLALHYARKALTVEPFSEKVCERLMELLLMLNQPSEAILVYQNFCRRLKEQFGQNASVFSSRLKALAYEAERRAAISQAKFLPMNVAPEMFDKPQNCQNFSLCSGTLTSLSVLLPSNARNPQVREVLVNLLRQYGGRVVKVKGSLVIGVFPCANWALECAFACQNQLCETYPRCFLDTFDFAESGKTEVYWALIEEMVVNFVGDCQIVCSETTASLLKRNCKLVMHLKPVEQTLHREFALLFVCEPEKPNKTLRTNLPPLTKNFFGRSEQLEQLRFWLLGEGERLVTLTGLGGCGKTSLAIKFAHQVLDDYKGAIWFIPLQSVSNPSIIGEILAKALGVNPTPESEPLQFALQFLEGQKCLLIWDGFEHLLPDGSNVLQEILERLPEAQNLITSCRPLGLPCERVLPVLPLPFPELQGEEDELDLKSLSQNPSVQIFVDRAKSVCPDFSLNEKTARKVAEICARLEGIPLSIVLAASWLAKLSLSQILERLNNPLEFLQTNQRNFPARHKSLRLVLTNTWELLPLELRQMLICLSAFRGGATIDALEKVSEDKNTSEAIAQLQDWALVYEINQHEVGKRFAVPDIVAEFVAEMATDELNEMRTKCSNFFLSLVEQFANYKGRNAEGWSDWLMKLEAERSNLRFALDWAVSHDPKTALRLMEALTKFWFIQGTFVEANEWAQRILANIPRDDENLLAKSMLLAGYWSIRVGNYNVAKVLIRSALALHEKAGDKRGQGEAHLNLSKIASHLGDYEMAIEHAKTSIAKFKEAGDLEGEAKTLLLWGSVEFRLGNLQDSQALYERSLRLFKILRNCVDEQTAKIGLANVAWRQGNYIKAEALYREALEFWGKVNPNRVTGILMDWGLIAMTVGDYERARKHYEMTLEIRRAIGDRVGVGAALNGLASVAWREGNLQEAQKLYSEALSIFQTLNNRWCIALTLTDLGNLALIRGDWELAKKLLTKSLMIWRELNDRWGVANALRKLALACANCSEVVKAVEKIRESIKLSESLGDKLGLVEGMEVFAQILCQLGNKIQAVQIFSAAANWRIRLGAPLPKVNQEVIDGLLKQLKTELGERVFEEAWQKGQKQNLAFLLKAVVATDSLTMPSTLPLKVHQTNSRPRTKNSAFKNQGAIEEVQ